ncbi:MAG: BrnT family toxin [Deltaproteobacteria bacterium]|nr:BrnT family toxin [Deltaproteobacteria bacterium]
MEFEFDEKKSEINKQKHGIDFYEIQALWHDVDLLEIPAKTVEDEGRFLVIGKIGDYHWSAVITYGNDATRIIAARRARKMEVQYYES